MKINSTLLPMKLHYFFIFAGTAPLIPFLPVYANQNLKLSYTGIGLVYTILPFIGLLAKATSGTVADWLNAHRKIFLSAIVVCAIGFFSIYFVPPMPTKPNPVEAKIQFDCSHPNSYLRHFIESDSDESVAKLIKNITTTCEVTCNVNEVQKKIICQSWDITDDQCTEVGLNITTFSNLIHLDVEGTDVFFPVANLSYMTNEITLPTCKQIVRVNCSTKCDNDDLMIYLGAPNSLPYTSYLELISLKNFWIFLICICIAWSGLAVVVVMSDTICFQLLGADANNYGKQRLFGSMGWGIFVTFTGFMIDLTSSSKLHANFTSAFILCVFLLFIDFIVATKLKVERVDSGQTDLSAVRKLFSDPRISLFILCCVIVGISTGVLWTYQLILVQTVSSAWDSEFQHLKLLQGLIVGVSCFGGEIPFFFLAGKIINVLGYVHSMSLVMCVFGIRYILYYTVVNPWYFLPIELLNGLTFGIFYTVMTSYANIIAPAGCQATMQGIVGASFEGLGIALGGFIGGALFTAKGGSTAFMIVGVFDICFAVGHFSLQMLLNKVIPLTNPDSPHHQGYLAPGEDHHPVMAGDEEPLEGEPKL